MKRYVMLLILLLYSVAFGGTTQTVTTIPEMNTSFPAAAIEFMRTEDALRDAAQLRPFVQSGLTAPASITLSHTLVAGRAWVSGYKVDIDAVVLTYTANRRTFLYADWLDDRLPTLPEITFTSGSGCTFKDRPAPNLVRAECSAGSLPPTPSAAVLMFAWVDTSGSAITLVEDRRQGGSMLPVGIVYASAPPFNVRCDGVTDDGPGIQAAFDSLPFDPGTFIRTGKVVLPDGTCEISNTILPRGNFILEGLNRGRTTIRYSGATAKILMLIDNSGHFTIRDISFKTTQDNLAHTHIHVRNSVFFRIEDVTSFVETPTSTNRAIGILVESTAPGQIPTRGAASITNYIYTPAPSSAAGGSRGIELRAGSGDDIRFVTINGHTTIEDAEWGILFTQANLNKVEGTVLLQGHTQGMGFVNSSSNSIYDVRYQQNGINHILDATSCDNIFVGESMTNPATFGTNSCPLGTLRFAEKGATLLSSMMGGVYTFLGSVANDGWINVFDDHTPTVTGMVHIDRGSQVAKDHFVTTTNGSSIFKVTVNGTTHFDGAQAQAGTGIKWHKNHTEPITFGAILAGATNEVTFGVLGVLLGDTCYSSPVGTMEAALIWPTPYVSGNGSVAQRINNPTLGTINPITRDWKIDCWRH